MEFRKEYINIIELLNSYAVIGRYRGEETWSEIEKVINGFPEYVLILIDLRQANPLEYVFCQYAFGPLIQILNDKKWQHKYIIFRMYDYNQSGFFRGILKYLGTDLPRKESKYGFVSSGMYAKLIVGDEEKIDFVGKLISNENEILEIVNEVEKATVREVVDKTGFPDETVVDALRSLVEKYFIVGPFTESDSILCYYSFYNYLKEESNNEASSRIKATFQSGKTC